MDLDDFLGKPRGWLGSRFSFLKTESNQSEPQHLTKFSNFNYIPKFHVIISFIHSHENENQALPKKFTRELGFRTDLGLLSLHLSLSYSFDNTSLSFY
jgi:hypothetical protein